MNNALSTGEFGKICGVGHRTVHRWIKMGYVNAFRLPGRRGDNRIPVTEAIRFLRDQSIPIPRRLLAFDSMPVIMVLDQEGKCTSQLKNDRRLRDCEINSVSTPFQLGIEIFKSPPMALVLTGKDNGGIIDSVKGLLKNSDELQNTKLIDGSGRSVDEIADAVQSIQEER